MEDSLDLEQRTLGHGMARLAQLNCHESVDEIGQADLVYLIVPTVYVNLT